MLDQGRPPLWDQDFLPHIHNRGGQSRMWAQRDREGMITPSFSFQNSPRSLSRSFSMCKKGAGSVLPVQLPPCRKKHPEWGRSYLHISGNQRSQRNPEVSLESGFSECPPLFIFSIFFPVPPHLNKGTHAWPCSLWRSCCLDFLEGCSLCQ